MKTLFICTLPRTGSSLLADVVASTGVLGDPREYLLPKYRRRLTAELGLDDETLPTYLTAVRGQRSTPNGVTSIKLMLPHIEGRVAQGELASPGLRSLADELAAGDPVVVMLSRRDKLRQAISLLRALQTSKWASYDDADGNPQFDQKLVKKFITRIVRHEGRWEKELATSGISADLRMEYEDVTRDMSGAINQIAVASGVTLPPPSEWMPGDGPSRVPQRDALTEEWVDRFLYA